MKVNDQQIQQLYKFTRAHYVEHFDVQTELVDHLANDIEQIWQEKPSLSFDEAKTISFKKFGIFGFMDVVAERQKALSKKYWKLIWSFTKNWFKLPKIILTALIFSLFYVVCKNSYGEYLLLSTLLILCLYLIYRGFILKRKFKQRFVETGKKWVLEEMIFTTGMGTAFLLPVNLFNIVNLTNFEHTISQSNFMALLYSAIFTFLVIVFYIAIEILPKKAEELLTEQYPEYKLVLKAPA